MHPEDVNVLCLKQSSFLIEKGEVGIDPLCAFCASLLSIRGMYDYSLKTWFDPGWNTLWQCLVFLVLILWYRRLVPNFYGN
jgi:hypothetical protein